MKVFTRNFYGGFCSKKMSEVHEKALKAIWAEKFYTEIFTNNQIQNNTLVDHLISLSLPSGTKEYFIKAGASSQNIDNQMKMIENEMKRAFKPYGGVIFPT